MSNNNPIKHFINIMLQGLFWLLPIVGILIILSWLYAKITMIRENTINFHIIAYDKDGIIAEAEHSRQIVDARKFNRKAKQKLR